MDYTKSGAANTRKTPPKPKRHTAKGAPARPEASDKQALIERMKAAAAARKG
jgi:hypothetical protein